MQILFAKMNQNATKNFFFPKTMIIMLFLFLCTENQQLIGTQCQFQQGSNFNCRQYCSQYFKRQPQLAWYNITSKNCEPLKICSIFVHYYHYETNQCYYDATMQKIAPSQYPQVLITEILNNRMVDSVCVNGVPYQEKLASMSRCVCYMLWEDSGKVDMYGLPYQCDKVIERQRWKGYFIRDLILDENGTVLMYGPYTPQQIQVIYKQLKEKQQDQVIQLVSRYEKNVLQLIYTQLSQQPWIRQHETIWIIFFGIFLYILFGLSYLRFQTQIVKVTRKEFIQRIQSIISDQNAFQGKL